MPQVSIPIIDQLVHPSMNLLSRVAVSGFPTLTGSGSLSPPQGPLALTYGFACSIFTRPTEWGLKVGNPDINVPAYLQLSTTYTDISGHTFVLDVVQLAVDGQFFFWSEPLPTALLYFVQPGFVLIPFWLQT